MLKNTFLLVFLIVFPSIIFGQKIYKKQIDSIGKLIEKSYLHGTSNPDLLLKNITDFYYLSREANYPEGQIMSLFEEAKMYYTAGEWDAALIKINEGIDLASRESDYNMLSRFALLQQRLLLDLDHLNASRKILAKAEEYNKLVTSEDDRHINHIFILLAQADIIVIKEDHIDQNQIVSLKKQALEEVGQLSVSNLYRNATEMFTLVSLTWSLTYLKDHEEAEKYSAILDQKSLKFKSEPLFAFNLIIKGRIANNQQNYPLAIQYLTEALDRSGKVEHFIRLMKIYPMLSESYAGMKDYEKANYYSGKYKRLVDSIDIIKKRSGDVTFVNEINNKIFNLKKTIDYTWYYISGGFVIAVLLGWLFYKKYDRKALKEVIPVSEVKVMESPIPIFENKPNTTKKLVQLAKEDINAFYIEFQKAYPSFYKTLQERYPELNISDINFCSLIKMSFGIKEISQYTNSTIRAAEARRYRINKKMDIKNQNELYMIISTINV